METPGASRSSSRMSPGISSAAVASAMASTKLMVACAGTNVLGPNTSCNWCKADRTAGQIARARGVGVISCPSRLISSSPTASRKRRIALLTAGWVMDRLRAARVRLRSVITSSKTRSRFRSNARKWVVFIGCS